MLIDTDVLIWYMRGNENAYHWIEEQDKFTISIVNYMEIVQGLRNKTELIEFQKALSEWNVNILQLTAEISSKAANLMEEFCLSHSLFLADSLIAATAIIHKIPILTANIRHFRIIRDVETLQFQP